jgi:NAD(P)H-hydrate epimerase
MSIVLTRQQVREIDRRAIEDFGLPGVVLMENAGRHVAELVLDLLEQELHLTVMDSRVGILCGGGNNGGDGYVAARHLHNHGVHVTAYAIKDPAQLRGEAAVHYQVAHKMNLVAPMYDGHLDDLEDELAVSQLIVDALLGTGFSGPMRDDLAAVIDICNRAHERGAAVVAVDVPSGLDCDTGIAADPTIHADTTITFVARKIGFEEPTSQGLLGEVVVADIGTPPELVQKVIGL